MVETSDDWITSRTGIKQRRKAAPGEYTSQFAVRAARQAIERAGLQAEDIDLLFCATVSPDQILPSTGCIIQAELGANKAAAMDVVAACSGFLYGLALADSMVRTGQSKYALVIGAEILTQYVDYTSQYLVCLATAPAQPCWGRRGRPGNSRRSDQVRREIRGTTFFRRGGGTPPGDRSHTGCRRSFFQMKGNDSSGRCTVDDDISREVLERPA